MYILCMLFTYLVMSFLLMIVLLAAEKKTSPNDQRRLTRVRKDNRPNQNHRNT